MARLIDADALMTDLDQTIRVSAREENSAEMRGIRKVLDRIKAAPTISPDDVRGVVHCKDCKWCHAGYCEKYDDLIPWGCANEPWEDWFCADGKRQETIKEEQDED